MRALLLSLALVASAAGLARAQQFSDPVAENYVAYRAALARGDAAAAEQAAEAALAASETRDGDGGRTAVLAYNLAVTRLNMGKLAEAHDPALRALTLSESQGAAAGLNPLLARLVLGQAELVTAPDAGRDRLLAALAHADSNPAVDERAYPAAAALGSWAFGAGQFDVAQTAWNAAAAHSPDATPVAVLLRERAHTGEAVALIAQHAGNPSAHERDDAYAMLNDVVNALYPYALAERPDHALTPFQAAFAEAKAWRDYGRAAYTATPPEVIPHNLDGQVMCYVRWHGNTPLWDALGLAHNVEAGGVVVFRINIDDAGVATRVDVASQAPTQDFRQNGTPQLSRLRFRRADDSERDCTMPSVVFQTVVLEETSTRRFRPNR